MHEDVGLEAAATRAAESERNPTSRPSSLIVALVPLALGAVFLLLHGAYWCLTFMQRRPKPSREQQELAKAIRSSKNVFMGPCWNLPFCRDTPQKL